MDSLDIAIDRNSVGGTGIPTKKSAEHLEAFLLRHQQLSHRFDESFQGLNAELHSLHIARFVAEHDAGVRSVHQMKSMVQRHKQEESLPRAKQNWLKLGHKVMNNNRCTSMRSYVSEHDTQSGHLPHLNGNRAHPMILGHHADHATLPPLSASHM